MFPDKLHVSSFPDTYPHSVADLHAMKVLKGLRLQCKGPSKELTSAGESVNAEKGFFKMTAL